MASPFLSIIVPVLNEAARLRARLDALQGLRGEDAELIVVDGGSDDATASEAGGLADQLLFAPRGRARQMNVGAQRSRGEVLLFLHADTALPEGALPLIRAAIAAGAKWGRFDLRLDSAHPLLKIVAFLMNARSRLTGIATGDQAIFVSRDLFASVGGYPDLALMEDIALSAKLKRVSRPACLRQQVVASARRWEENGILRTILLMWRLRAEFFLGGDPGRLALRYGYSPPGHFVQLAVFAKAPLAGASKTRLIPALGAEGAARLQRALTMRTLRLALAFRAKGVTLWSAPDVDHRFFRALARRCDLSLRGQSPGDLGTRMADAFAAHAGPTLLIGCDCPALELEHLARAASLLQEGYDAVFIPAEDGGYVLVGLCRPQPRLFEGIDWGSAQVMAQTRERLRECALRWAEPFTLWDVDRPEDLDRMFAIEGFLDAPLKRLAG